MMMWDTPVAWVHRRITTWRPEASTRMVSAPKHAFCSSHTLLSLLDRARVRALHTPCSAQGRLSCFARKGSHGRASRATARDPRKQTLAALQRADALASHPALARVARARVTRMQHVWREPVELIELLCGRRCGGQRCACPLSCLPAAQAMRQHKQGRRSTLIADRLDRSIFARSSRVRSMRIIRSRARCMR